MRLYDRSGEARLRKHWKRAGLCGRCGRKRWRSYKQCRKCVLYVRATMRTPKMRSWMRAYNKTAKRLEFFRKRMRTPKMRRACRVWSGTSKGRANSVVQSNRRRARLVNSEGSFTASQWSTLKRRYRHRCLCCGKRRKLTPDHVVPLVLGGDNRIENIQPLCGPCNSKKGGHTVDYRRRSLCL